jgi:hypothetical protein
MEAGRPDEFVKNRPRFSPTHFLSKLLRHLLLEKTPLKFGQLQSFSKMLNVNNRPISKNLVTLQGSGVDV